MISMTGYGSSQFHNDAFAVSVEIKSYNNRYLEISLYNPSFLGELEPDMRKMVKGRISRGHVDVSIRMKMLETDIEIHVDREVVRKLRDAYTLLAEEAGIENHPVLSDFLASSDVLKSMTNYPIEAYRPALMSLVEEALNTFCESREVEGAGTKRDIFEQLDRFEAGYETIRSFAEALEQRLEETLRQRFEQFLDKSYDEGRILQEVAVLLNRYTVNEEIQRIACHLDQFREISGCAGPVGKRLDFLCQELNREINTIGSKSVIAEVNQAVVKMKDALENIREQLRNVE